MKYVVSLGLNKFKFDNGATAMGFAELAAKYFTPTEYTSKIMPYITIDEEEEDDE